MPPIVKILFDVLSGVKDNNIAFSDLQKLLDTLIQVECINLRRCLYE